MKKTIVIFLTILLCSCQPSIRDKIVHTIKKQGQVDSCEIKMTDITSFDWDTMYVFGTSADLLYINQHLRFEYPYFDDIADRIIFTKSKKIVYHEEEYPDPEKKKLLIFSFEDGKNKMMSFTPNTAIFKAKKIDFYGNSFYELTPCCP